MRYSQPTRTDFHEALLRVVWGLMRQHRISGRQLTEATGIPKTTLSRRLSGELPFTVTQLDAIGAALGTKAPAIMARAARDAEETARDRETRSALAPQ